MLRDKSIKKITKKFANFAAEEEWLQDMLSKGWVLTSYDSEDIEECQYRFEALKSEEQRNYIYKIDFRSFKKDSDYQEYKTLFEDTGWKSLSRSKRFSKHIFYSDKQNLNKDIFSDKDSLKDREKRKMNTYLIYFSCSILLLPISFYLYYTYDRSSFLGAGFFAFFFNSKCLLDYFKHRKVYRSLEQQTS